MSVIPRDMFRDYPLKATRASEEGRFYKTADGTKVLDEGSRTLKAVNERGGNLNLRVSVAGVHKPLVSVSKKVAQGNTVTFGPGGSFIKHTDGSKTPMYLRNGTYVVKLKVKKHAGGAEQPSQTVAMLSTNAEHPKDRQARRP